MAAKLQASWKSYRHKESKSMQYLSSFDYWQIFSLLVLLGTGLLFIYSTGVQSGNEIFFKRQLFWVAFSIPVYVIFSHVNVRIWEVIAEPFFIISLILLVIVLIFGVKISGARRWLDLYFFNFQSAFVECSLHVG